jgi:nickel-dependent lactate racemase
MRLEFGFGSGVQAVEAPDQNVVGVLTPNAVQLGSTGANAVAEALNAPIGSPRLRDRVRPGETVAIITSDATAPRPPPCDADAPR